MEARELYASSRFVARRQGTIPACANWRADRPKHLPTRQFTRHGAIQPVSSVTSNCTDAPVDFQEKVSKFFHRALLSTAVASILFIFGRDKLMEPEHQNPVRPMIKMEESLPDKHLPNQYKQLAPQNRPHIKILPPIEGLTA
ncbi:MAG: hypothetical protein K2Z81_07905 [Cyanobacteria bacterium]|nr:hypothetical protein [Cyanobacteriota bacterium]